MFLPCLSLSFPVAGHPLVPDPKASSDGLWAALGGGPAGDGYGVEKGRRADRRNIERVTRPTRVGWMGGSNDLRSIEACSVTLAIL